MKNITEIKSPAIVIPCYNRPHSLNRLLKSLAKGHYSSKADLVLSIDGGGPVEVNEVVQAFDWPYGEKRVIARKENLGLKNHILSCGDLTQEYGAILLLEDDLLVSSQIYEYALSVMASGLLENDRVVGASTYSYRLSETTRRYFYPIEDGYDNYFLQFPSSWGQIWIRESWVKFTDWLSQVSESDVGYMIPNKSIIYWGNQASTSWKRYFAAFMADTDTYMVYPRVAFSDNPGEEGTHHKGVKVFQTKLYSGSFIKTRFSAFDNSLAIYDQNFELDPRIVKKFRADLAETPFSVNLHGADLNESCSQPWVITFLNPEQSPVATWGNDLFPPELNVIHDNPGTKIGLVPYSELCLGDLKRRVILGNGKYFTVRDSLLFFCESLKKKTKKIFKS